ncbi:unnamed protein product [Polarella glacialis]|uniref:Uncharacterized protein n=1 Tax=Polarella glacialis TaxID=89957 RepID=A0A813IHZ0_POLGL|nr:unnamed protein product [Polarella glacialis]CAE8644343.1 unnamed protein product [Polarella glacialis]CAE8650539.1 unnamed protein product [Polarella glacialis]|mmetsp:Transcript_1486/g.2277  ORF Transcript_1486/g.2277 Transcript_1486/m.2277 type:complete len:157 (-) Transcript_1486:52-522(-)
MAADWRHSNGVTYVPLEVAPPLQQPPDAAEPEVGFKHALFGRRMARRQRSYATSGPDSAQRPGRRCLVGGFAMGCVIAAFVLWGWTLVLLLLRFNQMRLNGGSRLRGSRLRLGPRFGPLKPDPMIGPEGPPLPLLRGPLLMDPPPPRLLLPKPGDR